MKLEDVLIHGKPYAIMRHLCNLGEALSGEDFQKISDPIIKSRIERTQDLIIKCISIVFSEHDKSTKSEELRSILTSEDSEIIACLQAFLA